MVEREPSAFTNTNTSSAFARATPAAMKRTVNFIVLIDETQMVKLREKRYTK